MPGDPRSDAGADDASQGPGGGGACIADTLPCGPTPEPCVGDCLGRACCGKFCASGTCASPNMTFGPTACPSPCGGDAIGTWELVGGCSSTCGSTDKGATGAVATTSLLLVGVDGGSTVSVGYDTHCGGYINTGGARDVDGRYYRPDAGTMGTTSSPYCVIGNDLWVFPKEDFGGTGKIAVHFQRK